MGAFNAKLQSNGTYEPSSTAIALAVPPKSGYTEPAFEQTHRGKAKILVVCTDDGKLTMANGRVFSSGNHPVEVLLPLRDFEAAGFAIEFATASGEPVVLEEWACPAADAEFTAFLEKLRPALMKPLKLDAVDRTLKPYAAVFLPGGHACMVNLPESKALGDLQHTAHERAMPTVSLCHGPATLLATTKSAGKPFPYAGYKAVCFTAATDMLMLPTLGYMPGRMPWHPARKLAEHGVTITNYLELGSVVVDRELITGDSPYAANALGKTAAPLAVEWAAREGL